MKKEYLALIALILISSAYLLLHKGNRDHYVLPEIKPIDISGITGLTLDKKEGRITFTKKENHWILTDNAYPADSSSVESMLDTVKTFKLTALVSQKGDLKRYELDADNHIRVKVLDGETTLFEFTMGKTAPSFNHTFVMLTDDKNIYHANGGFRSHFDKTVEAFRDKKVLEFKEASIKRLILEKDGISGTLTSTEGKKDKEEAAITWRFEDGTAADPTAVSNLLSSVSFLECEKYPDAPAKNELENKAPLCRIRLENEGNLDLTLFKIDSEDNLMAISSMSDYVFELSRFNGKEIVSGIEQLLGITREKENKE